MDSEAFLRVQVVGMFLHSLAFGIYLVTCGYCFRPFFTTRSRHGISETLLLAVFLMFFAKITASVVLHLDLSLRAIGSKNAALQFTDGSDPINMFKSTTVLIQTAIMSGVLIYRCWLVHGRGWLVVALPIAFWLGGVAVMGIVIHIDTADNVDGLFAISLRSFGCAFWAIIIALNIITTGLIARRIWRVDHLNKGQRATRIIIDSGLIYTTMSLITFFLFVVENNAAYAAIDVLVQAIGISFNLIIIHNSLPAESSWQSNLNDLNNVPLQFVSSNMSIPGSAIEFAYPKHFMPRRKNRPASVPAPTQVQDDADSLSVAEIPKNHSQQSIT
ncbi:hypothetical protein C8R44DRAFT_879032 [Mycena epipterygia]|nr:hypothetical protein C8R44DRAFT_879032 [Mycena epipterygia]